ncbi:helix-turn-helix domain-containing protein [Micrococcus sp. 2A]|uniref:helix-turn-helix domain-containing protein n=1 Tax=Micrococcus sp. 2A TaxID=3142261 RepID=UPI002636CA7B|nr:helix-turn-helix domain-containing protein [uncultured Micrococcus sp.]
MTLRASAHSQGRGSSPLSPLTAQLTISDAAALLGASPNTVRRMIARGDLRAYRYGPRLIRIDPADLHALRVPVTSLAELRGADAR